VSSAAPEAPAAGVQAAYQAALDAGSFRLQHCARCARHVFFPRELCPKCSGALAWVEPSGLGRVHAVTTMRRKPAEGGDLGVCLVDLDEGVRLMSRVDHLAPGAVRIGQRVRARVAVKDGRGLLLFDAVAESEATTEVPR